MKSLLLTLTSIILLTLSIQAQSLIIKGAVVDTASIAKLRNASISVLNAKDSTLVKFTRAVNDGAFTISNLKPGKFILLTTYPGYADYVEHFKLDSTQNVKDFGKINMILKTNLLKDVLIKAKTAAIKIKGDTTEYDAGSFKVEPNAKVEDLLKQLPGIQVDKDGKITAQGQTVSKVLVDGEEFFGDDPTLVTKNLRADMIDKVQLYDKKSDQAAFTGIDDGVKNKTINLKLKEDKKNGMFGKVNGGSLNDGFYSGQGMINMFKGKKKFSAYGTVGNTGKTGLDWGDSEKYGSSNMNVSDEGYFYMEGGRDELDQANFRGSGLPEIRTGGVHYDAKWNNNKQSINTNYKSGYLTVDGNENSGSFNNIPGEGRYINTNSTKKFDNVTFRQKADATYQISPDSTSNLKFTIDGIIRNNDNSSYQTSLGRRIDNTRINDFWNNTNNESESQSFNASAFYSKKLKKKGRTYSINFTQNLNKGNSTGTLNSENKPFDLHDEVMTDSIVYVDQLKRNKSFSSRTNTNLTYTEPITKQWSLVLNYGFSISNSNSDRRSFNKSVTDYNLLDSVYSNNFDVNQLTNQGGAVFSFKKKKTNITMGTRATAFNFNQKDLFYNKRYDRDFINWNPQASYQYKFSNFKSFRAEYNGRTSQPSIEQLQPVRANTDPQNISLGNPDLKPSFTNSFNMRYNSYKVLSERSVYAYGSYSYTTNPIISSTLTNLANNVTTYQSVNLKNKNSVNYYLYSSISRKITKFGINVGLDLNTDANIYYSYNRDTLIKSSSNNYAGGFSISKYKQKKYEAYLSFTPSYNKNESSLPNSKNNNGWVYNSNAGFGIQLPGKFEINSNARYEFREKTASFNENFEQLIWDASFSKKFMKQDNLKLSLSANDILNQNNGFSRRINNTIVTQRSYTTIKRYFLLSLVWEFNKMGGGVKSSESAKETK